MTGNVKRSRVSASEEFAAVVREMVRCHPER
ncbi:unknown [Dialister invisus CAG:218]|nr:unknown [Dialister invisus CAG:218]